ncbi:hypothetical protein QBC40DRAFT_281573 [Triangularia verruculosa]|uniref:Hsp70 family chaperone n=1 Tax=Triangularia verruculosa TaxID=2587418 RepID=A0AAN7AU82_9PEZI|nr:hypothetical protein QBC40DRAFT_281573 [Triangularia verruculosa]
MAAIVDKRLPDVRVAIDYGTTFTGVAWQDLRTQNCELEVEVIDDWPGYHGQEATKVPSVLAKLATKLHDGQVIRKWGFLCDETDEDNMGNDGMWRYLKICLDPVHHRDLLQQGSSCVPPTLEEVHHLVYEYLRQIYRHVEGTITRKLSSAHEKKSWDDLSVEFVFSVPTTWEGPEILDDFRKIIGRAGFGSCEKHNAIFGLTEAEAAAVAVLGAPGLQLPFKDGDIFLSIDGGGGTTDFALVKATKTKPPAMEQIQAVQGIGIGSMLIDLGFQQLVVDRLRSCSEQHPQLPHKKTALLSQSDSYLQAKHKFGESHFMENTNEIEVPGLGPHGQCKDPRMKDGVMRFTTQEFKNLFDDQLMEILSVLDKVVGRIKPEHAPVRHIILSGGLGSSAYIFDKLQEHIERSTDKALRGARLHMSRRPQLVVVHGLLLEQSQGVLRERIARASYGLLITQLYSPKTHFGQEISRDSYDRKKYVHNQIHWVVKQDEIIKHGKQPPIRVERRIDLDSSLQWTETIVTSNIEAQWLPGNRTESTTARSTPIVRRLCNVPVDLNHVRASLPKKKRQYWSIRSTEYYFCQYDIYLDIGASGDMRVEVHHEGNLVGNATLIQGRIEVCSCCHGVAFFFANVHLIPG